MKNQRVAVRTVQVMKSFSDGTSTIEVLKGIDLVCYTGEILMIVGPSGCGKTTLLSCIAGTLTINSGSIEIFDQPLEKMTSAQLLRFRSRHIGFIFQQFNLIPTIDLIENVSIPLFIHSIDQKNAFKEAKMLLEKVGLENKGHQYPTQLSGGQQQRVAIARALIHQPDLVICDEPTSSLDGKTGHTIVELLQKIAKDEERAVMIVTHDSRIFHFADRIVELEDGRVLRTYQDYHEFSKRSL